eukprot:1156636-Pelagomonas_calceolata.AAC.20
MQSMRTKGQWCGERARTPISNVYTDGDQVCQNNQKQSATASRADKSCLHVHVCLRAHTYTHVHTQTHIYTHSHTHTTPDMSSCLAARSPITFTTAAWCWLSARRSRSSALAPPAPLRTALPAPKPEVPFERVLPAPGPCKAKGQEPT